MANKPTDALPRPGVPRVLSDFETDFLCDPPPGAEAGLYASAAHDRWHGKTFAGLHGLYRLGALGDKWSFRFAKGHFVDAVHETRQAMFAERLTAARPA